MKLKIDWSRPVLLRKAAKNENLIYQIDLLRVAQQSGVYIFGRRFGSGFEALYVGKAENIRGRVKGHLKFNLQLMMHLQNAKNGRRILLVGTLLTGKGQRLAKCMTVAERALIRHFLSEGHDIANVSGTRIRRHEIASFGRYPKRYFPGTIYLEKSKGE